MTKKEDVIRTLTKCSSDDPDCAECPYFKCDDCIVYLMMDAAQLLKEQEAVNVVREHEPVKPELRMSKHGFRQWIVCGNCYEKIYTGDDYCRHCGRKVQWDA